MMEKKMRKMRKMKKDDGRYLQGNFGSNERNISDDSNGQSGSSYIDADQHTPVDSYTDFRNPPTRREVPRTSQGTDIPLCEHIPQ